MVPLVIAIVDCYPFPAIPFLNPEAVPPPRTPSPKISPSTMPAIPRSNAAIRNTIGHLSSSLFATFLDLWTPPLLF